MRSKRHNKQSIQLVAAVIAAAAVIIALYFLLHSSGAAVLPTIGDVNSYFGNNTYSLVTVPVCRSSSLLFNNIRANSVCTEVFLSNNNQSQVPYSITAFSYSFASNPDAGAYIANVIPEFNDTPWPDGAKTFSNISTSQNLTIYYTTVVYRTSTPYDTVVTIYSRSGSLILGVSAIVDTGQNTTLAQSAITHLLSLAYSRS